MSTPMHERHLPPWPVKPKRPAVIDRGGEWAKALAETARNHDGRPEPVPVYQGPSRLKARLNARRRREQEATHAV